MSELAGSLFALKQFEMIKSNLELQEVTESIEKRQLETEVSPDSSLEKPKKKKSSGTKRARPNNKKETVQGD